MVRPSDWFLVELPGDPTPGDAFGIRSLSNTYASIASIAGEASTGIRHARSSSAAAAWIGDAGDVFRDKSERMPGELAKAHESYAIVADALKSWADAVDDTQAQADRGLQQAREAHADLVSAQSALGAAQHSWTTVHAQQLSYQKLQKDYDDVPPPSNVTMPTDYQLRSVDRSAQQAQASIAAAQAAIGDAEARLDAAKRLVMEAKSRRDEAEQAVVHRIGAAKDAAVKPSSIWEAIQDSAAWQTIVTIATVVLTIVSIVAIFVGGPIVWAIIAAATILLMLNALMSIAQGKNAWLELGLLAIGLIPGGRALSSVAEIATAFRTGSTVGRGLLAVGTHLLTVSKGALLDMARSVQKTATGLVPGVTSMLRSLPNAASLAYHSSAQFLEFASKLGGSMRSDYQLAADVAWSQHIVEVGRTDPAHAAALWQANPVYHNVDPWTNTTTHFGQSFEMGAGGPVSGFVFDGGTAAQFGNEVHDVWGAGQVAASDQFGLRHEMFSLHATENGIPHAQATVTANPYLGPGGASERFFPDMAANLQQGQLVVTSTTTHLPLPVEFEPIMNNANDVLGYNAFVRYGPDDVIRLTDGAAPAVYPTAGEVTIHPFQRIGFRVASVVAPQFDPSGER